jgi:hypothetical protein
VHLRSVLFPCNSVDDDQSVSPDTSASPSQFMHRKSMKLKTQPISELPYEKTLTQTPCGWLETA